MSSVFCPGRCKTWPSPEVAEVTAFCCRRQRAPGPLRLVTMSERRARSAAGEAVATGGGAETRGHRDRQDLSGARTQRHLAPELANKYSPIAAIQRGPGSDYRVLRS